MPFAASLAVTVNWEPPAEPIGGVPLSRPSAEKLAQAGSPITDQAYGAVPPLALNFTEYAWPSTACSRGGVTVMVMEDSGLTFKLNIPLACTPKASLTLTVKLYKPADSTGGVPLRSPLAERLKKAGRPELAH